MTTPNPTQMAAPVIQSDRDFAADVYGCFRYGATVAIQATIRREIERGQCDNDPIIQAVAAYRVQIEQSSRVGEGGAEEFPNRSRLVGEALKEAETANVTIGLGRAGQGSGYVKVATAMHRIQRLLRAALANPPLSPVGDARDAKARIEHWLDFGVGYDKIDVTFRNDLRAALQSSTSAHVPDTAAVEQAARYVLENSRRGNASLSQEQFDADTDKLMAAYRDIITKAVASGFLSAAPALKAGEG